MVVQRITNNIGDGLCIGSGATTAAIDFIADLCQFVGDTIGDICSSSCTRVGPNYNATIELNGHNRRLHANKTKRKRT